MKAWKLTDANGQTYGGTQWGEGVTHEASGEGDLCGSGWLHFYDDPLLAVLFNPIHTNFGAGMQLWEAVAEGAIKPDNGLKFGCSRLTTVRRVDAPEVTMEQRIRFGILCAKEVCDDPAWNAWADRWLSGKDRTARAAAAAREATWAAQEAWEAATWAATWAAAWAERAACAARAAAAAAAWEAAWEATWEAARAVRAAAAEAATRNSIDLKKLASAAVEGRRGVEDGKEGRQ